MVHGTFSNAVFICFGGSKINHSILGVRVCLLSLRQRVLKLEVLGCHLNSFSDIYLFHGKVFSRLTNLAVSTVRESSITVMEMMFKIISFIIP